MHEPVEDHLATPAIFSPCRKYRYTLTRQLNPLHLISNDAPEIAFSDSATVAFLCLNPSTADEHKNDPTVTRCMKYAESWGFEFFVMLNLFAWRSTSPSAMKKVIDPIGNPDNDAWINAVVKTGAPIVCAWGTHGKHHMRDSHVVSMLKNNDASMWYLHLNNDGTPKHPLYIRRTVQPKIWE